MTDLAAQTQLEKYQKAAASLDKFLEQATDDQKFDLGVGTEFGPYRAVSTFV